MARGDALVHHGRAGGQRQGRLGDIVGRAGQDAGVEFLPLRLGGMRADQHPVAAGALRQLHHQLIEVGEDVFPVLLPLAQEGRHIGQQRLLPEVEAHHLRHIGVDRLVVGDPGPRGIGQRDIAGAIGRHQPGHADQAVRAEGLRVEEFIVDPAVDHIHPLRPGGGAHEHHLVLHEKIGTLHHLDPHLIGEEAVLVIGAVVGAGGQQHDAGLGAGAGRGDGLQRLQQLLRVARDRGHLVPGAEPREEPQHRLPILQHVGDAGGGAAIILEHIELIRSGADHVDPGDMGIDPARRGQPDHLRPVALILQHQRSGDLAGAQDLLLAIDIAEEGVEGADPLAQPGGEPVPFGARQDAGDQVEGDQPLRVPTLPIDREGDADAAEQQLRLPPLGVQLFARRGAEPAVDLGIGGAHAILGPHFIESGGLRL